MTSTKTIPRPENRWRHDPGRPLLAIDEPPPYAVINPDGAANQIEGAAIHGVSMALKEAVRFDRRRVTSDSWAGYPILRFSEVPEVEVRLIARPEEPPLGAGEAALALTIAAIANAIRDALGVHPHRMPFTPDNIAAGADA